MSNVGRQVNYRNPHGSVPSPAAKEIPTTLWYTQERMAVPWAGLGGGNDDIASWNSPTFDLRPDLRSSQSMARSGVPVWDTAARLYVQIFGLTTADAVTQDLRLGYREFANTTFGDITEAGPNRAVAPPGGGFPNQIARNPVVRVTPLIDISSEVMLGTNQPDSVVLVFETLGEGYPVRYWRLGLTWRKINAVGPVLFFQAAMY